MDHGAWLHAKFIKQCIKKKIKKAYRIHYHCQNVVMAQSGPKCLFYKLLYALDFSYFVPPYKHWLQMNFVTFAQISGDETSCEMNIHGLFFYSLAFSVG